MLYWRRDRGLLPALRRRLLLHWRCATLSPLRARLRNRQREIPRQVSPLFPARVFLRAVASGVYSVLRKRQVDILGDRFVAHGPRFALVLCVAENAKRVSRPDCTVKCLRLPDGCEVESILVSASPSGTPPPAVECADFRASPSRSVFAGW